MNRMFSASGYVIGVLGLAVLAHSMIRAGIYVAALSAVGVSLFLFCLRPEHRQEMGSRVLFGVIAMPILAWTLPNVWLLHLTMVFWVPLLAGRFDRLVPVYLFSLLLLPALDVPVLIGSLRLFDIGVHDGLAIGTAIAIGRGMPNRNVPFRSDVWIYGMLMVLGIALSRETSATNLLRNTVNVMLDLGLPYYIFSRGLRGPEQMRTAIRWFVCGGMALSTEMVFEASRSWPIYNELYGHYRVALTMMVHGRAGLLRPGGSFCEPTSVAMVLAMCLIALLLLRTDFRSRLHYYAALGVMGIGVFVPQSRGAWIGFFTALIAADLFRGRYLAIIRKLAVIGGAVGMVFVAAHTSTFLSETLGLTGGASDSADYRRQLFQRGSEEFWKSPIIGYPVPELSKRLADIRQGEGIIDFVNTYLWLALISGSVGLFLFIGTFASFLARLWLARPRLAGVSAVESGAFVFASLAMSAEMLFFTSFIGRCAALTFGLFGFAAAVLSAARVPRGEPPRMAAPAAGGPAPWKESRA